MNKRNINRNITIIALFLAGIIATLAAAVPPPSDYRVDRILNAIRQVETGGCKDPTNAVGDGGQAIGPFQIHQSYWQDAVDYDPSIGGVYGDCKNEEYARRIVTAYLSRYCKVWTDENASRIHNGGGGILKRQHSTKAKDQKAWANSTKYWSKVKSHLD